jgi:hypothetical protein
MRTFFMILSCLFLLAGSGCRRTKHGTMSGRLLENCSGTPAVNETIYFYQTRFGGGKGPKVAEVTTDSNGYFSVGFEYTRRRSLIMYADGGKMIRIPVDTAALGDIYLERETRSVIKVTVTNAYALSNDELVLQYEGEETHTMHTPFHDTVFPVHLEHRFGLPHFWGPLPESMKHLVHLSYTNHLLPPGLAEIHVSGCSSVPDTIYLKIN